MGIFNDHLDYYTKDSYKRTTSYECRIVSERACSQIAIVLQEYADLLAKQNKSLKAADIEHLINDLYSGK